MNVNNNATTKRLDEYKGTIAVDHQTAGKSIAQIIEPFISVDINEGYIFSGIKIYITNGNITEPYPVTIILGKKVDEEWVYKKVVIQLSLKDLLLATTAIEIRFGQNLENENINWDDI